jgi:hypothetical protein
MFPRASAWLACAAIAALALGPVAACGTNATGVTACNSIESARCRRATGCGISLEPPYTTDGNDVDACIRFYRVACLHGLSGSDPGPIVTQQCVSAIASGTCDVVRAPETSPLCAFLIPPSVPDAAADVTDAAADAATDGSDATADAPAE